MADKVYQDAFNEVLQALEPRTPSITLYLERPTPKNPAHMQDVQVALWDSLTCAEIARYNVDPVSALHLLSKASQFALDCELVDQSEFECELYGVVNAWYHSTFAKLETLEQGATMLATHQELLDLLAKRLADGTKPIEVKIGAATYLVR